MIDQHGDPFADLPGAGPATTVTLIAQSGDVRRFRNKDACARYGGIAPIPCGSGTTAGRRRLHRGGNRQINAALHRIAITKARVDPRARAYVERRSAKANHPAKPPAHQTPPRQHRSRIRIDGRISFTQALRS